ncbi:DUF2779 domain-containing protein [Mesomycoplasma molare]|uniref:DUF2779 domain-containing protein n=1 Tax=Mesomycoplasma molare TaxID=171288 RepID=A0ABY5TV84_9BACT|nr:DUF2779 domain-containing protein [Mesomycoplasma molare]UWD34557.1 DUF2779 domain-containing protein [Mesomycoplasma molare]
MEKELITYRHFHRLITGQKFFIWNKLSDHFLDLEEDGEDHEHFWNPNHAIDITNKNNISIVEAREEVFSTIEKAFLDYILNKYGKENVYVIKSKTTELAIQETQEIINKKTHKIILYPVFIYKNAIAKPTFIDLEQGKISLLKLTGSTKRKDILKAYWDFWIVNKTIKLNNISFHLIDYVLNPKKNEKKFIEIFYLNINKSKKNLGIKYKEIYTKEEYKKYKIIAGQIGLIPEEYDKLKSGNYKPINKIYDIVSSMYMEINSKKEEYYDFLEINDAIDLINKAKEKEELEELSEVDNGFFEPNPDFNEILKLKAPILQGYSGNIFKKEKIIELISKSRYESIENQLRDDFLYNSLNIKEKVKIFKSKKLEEKIKILNNDENRIIWYDFEGFSLPYPPLDGVLPYNQIVFQLSIKETHKGRIVKNNFDIENIVYDPQKISIQSFEEIITKIYSNKADYFVVYNKNYENTRIKEMIELIRTQDEAKAKKMQMYFEHIEKNTIDLADFFSGYSSKGNLPMIFIPDLKGYFSIKKIEKYITKEQIPLAHLITPYQELKVQNGTMAMSKAIARYVGNIGDKEWEETKKELKKYCENDVMAMIMVKDFINWAFKKYK